MPNPIHPGPGLWNLNDVLLGSGQRDVLIPMSGSPLYDNGLPHAYRGVVNGVPLERFENPQTKSWIQVFDNPPDPQRQWIDSAGRGGPITLKAPVGP